MTYKLSDLYPGYTGYGYDDTSNKANVSKDSQEQLLVDPKITDQADKQSNSKQILIAVLLIGAMAVFFGTD